MQNKKNPGYGRKFKFSTLMWLSISVLTINCLWYTPALSLDVTYVVEVREAQPDHPIVSMTISNITTNTIRLIEMNTGSGYQLSLDGINAVDLSQNPLSVTAHPGEPDSWSIELSGNTSCVVEYTVNHQAFVCSSCPNNETLFYSYSCEDFLSAMSAHLFVIPGDDTNLSPIEADSLTVSFILPEQWNVVVPWPSENGVYRPQVFTNVDFYDNFGKHTIGLGNFDTYTQIIGNSTITAAFYAQWPDNLKAFITQNLWDVMSYQSTVWGDSLTAPYIALFPPYDFQGDLLAGTHGPMGQVAPLPVDLNYDWTNLQDEEFVILYSAGNAYVNQYTPNWVDFSHEVSETRWINYDWGYTDNACYWLKFGGSQYYGIKTALRAGRCSTEYSINNLLGKYQSYVDNYVTPGIDIPLSDAQADNDKLLAGYKGPMVILFLSKEIYTRSNGTLTLDGLQRNLFEEYGFNTRIEENILKSEVEEYTGSDFTQFFNDFIHGTEPLPVAWLTLDNDQDGVSNGGEVLYDTNPDHPDVTEEDEGSGSGGGCFIQGLRYSYY